MASGAPLPQVFRRRSGILFDLMQGYPRGCDDDDLLTLMWRDSSRRCAIRRRSSRRGRAVNRVDGGSDEDNMLSPSQAERVRKPQLLVRMIDLDSARISRRPRSRYLRRDQREFRASAGGNRLAPRYLRDPKIRPFGGICGLLDYSSILLSTAHYRNAAYLCAIDRQ